ncbi:biopolymer transporter ExbD [Xylophilus sp. GOD-11R]|uniref:ExbD/TolR family protein n=1 Tax=Xylophilus sp. GOD-11R TaxID=3089814 RepID=UPI00298D4CF1|nr:biopolymer transporter ExbD [Xylophilus sp. GOD-11R]WPB59388.1 biopolymer transporter ExbD [Xylophilus sp. GOD-11R]
MDFRAGTREEPEINLIPFIDVLLVVVIFLMLSTTYSRFTELQLRLPVADAQAQRDYPREVRVSITSDGRISINGKQTATNAVDTLGRLLEAAATAGPQSIVVISADANAAHQNVITVMEAARRAGLGQITFSTQRPGPASGS